MKESLQILANRIDEKNLRPSINLERPHYVQPEDLIKYRSARIVLILGMLNTIHGLSKELVSCLDFLLRNPGYQRKFILEYFKNQKNLIKKLNSHSPTDVVETDFHIIRYKSIPWDLRFNDMFLFLYVRKLVEFKGKKPSLRVKLTEYGERYSDSLKEIFVDEVNFLEIFGKSVSEKKTIKIITDVIPNSYWKENEKINY